MSKKDLHTYYEENYPDKMKRYLKEKRLEFNRYAKAAILKNSDVVEIRLDKFLRSEDLEWIEAEFRAEGYKVFMKLSWALNYWRFFVHLRP